MNVVAPKVKAIARVLKRGKETVPVRKANVPKATGPVRKPVKEIARAPKVSARMVIVPVQRAVKGIVPDRKATGRVLMGNVWKVIAPGPMASVPRCRATAKAVPARALARATLVPAASAARPSCGFSTRTATAG